MFFATVGSLRVNAFLDFSRDSKRKNFWHPPPPPQWKKLDDDQWSNKTKSIYKGMSQNISHHILSKFQLFIPPPPCWTEGQELWKHHLIQQLPKYDYLKCTLFGEHFICSFSEHEQWPPWLKLLYPMYVIYNLLVQVVYIFLLKLFISLFENKIDLEDLLVKCNFTAVHLCVQIFFRL